MTKSLSVGSAETLAIITALRKTTGVIAASVHRHQKDGRIGIVVKTVSPAVSRTLSLSALEAGFTVELKSVYFVIS